MRGGNGDDVGEPIKSADRGAALHSRRWRSQLAAYISRYGAHRLFLAADVERGSLDSVCSHGVALGSRHAFPFHEQIPGYVLLASQFCIHVSGRTKKNVDSGVDLAHVREFINCSEPVRERSLKVFTDAFSALGVRPDQCQASCTMAENTFAVTQTPLGVPPVIFE